MKEPGVASAPAGELLFRRHFQTAYVVRDMAEGKRLLSDRLGVTDWLTIETDSAGTQVSRSLSFAYVGERMIELVEPNAERPSLYSQWMPPGDEIFRFHHLAFLVDTPVQHADCVSALDRAGYPEVYRGEWGNKLLFSYCDTTAALGHFYETICWLPDAQSFISSIPRN